MPPFIVDAPGGGGPGQRTQPAPVTPNPLLRREPFDPVDVDQFTDVDPPLWTDSGSSQGGGGFQRAMPGWLPTAASAVFGPIVGAGVGLMGQPRLDENLVYQNEMRRIAGLDPVAKPEGLIRRSFGWLTGDDPRPRTYQEGFGDIEDEMVARNKADYEEARATGDYGDVAPWSDIGAVEGARQQFGAATMGRAGVGNIGGTFGRPGNVVVDQLGVAGFGDADGWTTGGIPAGLGGESGYGTRGIGPSEITRPVPPLIMQEARDDAAKTRAAIDDQLASAKANFPITPSTTGAPDRQLTFGDMYQANAMSRAEAEGGLRSWDLGDALGAAGRANIPLTAALANVPNQFDYSAEGGGFGIPGMSAARYGMDYALPDVGGYNGAGFGGGGDIFGPQEWAWQ